MFEFKVEEKYTDVSESEPVSDQRVVQTSSLKHESAGRRRSSLQTSYHTQTNQKASVLS